VRIGILTWYYAANYGAQAHAHALQKIIKSMGHSCEMIRFYTPQMKKVDIKAVIAADPAWRRHPLRTLRSVRRIWRIRRFSTQLPQSPIVKDGAQIDALGYDLVILGSDEILNVLHPSHNPLYYGIGIKKTPKITYAPSSGQTDIETVLSDKARKSLASMVSLSARDKHTAQLLMNNCGRDIPIVADPTLLYDFSQVMAYLPEEKYLLVYSFGALEKHAIRIKEYARQRMLKIVSIGNVCNFADISYDIASVPEWMGAFYNASCVVTDSFHGTIFALKNQKEFVLIGRSDKTNKIMDFMDYLEIRRGFYSGNQSISQYLQTQPIDYNNITPVLERQKEFSIEYLQNAFSKI
jgi:polysaccharide pyruvyl transferase WcaK-like protein